MLSLSLTKCSCIVPGDRRSVRSGLQEMRRQDRRRMERPDDGQVRFWLQRGLHGRVQDPDSQKDLPESCRTGGLRIKTTVARSDAGTELWRHRGSHIGQAGLGETPERRGSREEGVPRRLGDEAVSSDWRKLVL